MTQMQIDRIEAQLPELLSEIGATRVPDYFDDMLRQTGRTRQRPAWSLPERWLPLDTVARPAAFGRPALRPLLVLVLIGLLVAASVAFYAGSQRTRLPEPFGLARNGPIVLGASDDITLYDPANGSTTILIGGATRDAAPWLSRNGQQFIFLRFGQGEDGTTWLANVDGSAAHEIAPWLVDWIDWSDDPNRVVVNRTVDGGPETSVRNLETGAATVLNLGFPIDAPIWRAGHDELIVKPSNGSWSLVDSDGTNLRPIDGVSPDAVNEAAVSPDGSTLTYASWDSTDPTMQGRIHALDIDTGVDRVLHFDGAAGTSELFPRFAPDGSLLFERMGADPSYEIDGELVGARLVVAPADGSRESATLGRLYPQDKRPTVEFSPDGTQAVVYYEDDGSTWLLNLDGSGEQQLSWDQVSGFSWQRLAP